MKLLQRSLVLFVVVLAFSRFQASGAFINEIRTDQPGADNEEYFEIGGSPGESLEGLSYLVLGDGTDGQGFVEFALNLTGSSLDDNGLFVVGEVTMTLATPDLVTGLNFENSDNVTHLLVNGFTGTMGDILDADNDGNLGSMPWSSVVDAVGLAETTDVPANGDFFYGASLGGTDLGPDGFVVPSHVYRTNSNQPVAGSWNIGRPSPASGFDTPGAINVPEPTSNAVSLLGLAFFWRRSSGKSADN